MTAQIRVTVYRRLENRLEGFPDDSPRALELHNKRRDALLEALDGRPDVKVLDWGKTKDAKAHEWVTLVVEFLANPQVVDGAMAVALGWLGARINDAVSDLAVDGIKRLIRRLLPQQKRHRILDFDIGFPNGERVTVYPRDDDAEIKVSTSPDSITISFADVPDEENRRVLA